MSFIDNPAGQVTFWSNESDREFNNMSCSRVSEKKEEIMRYMGNPPTKPCAYNQNKQIFNMLADGRGRNQTNLQPRCK